MNFLLYFLVSICLVFSFIKDKKKTKLSLLKAIKAFENILPQFIVIILSVSLLLSFFDGNFISKFIGEGSGYLGILFSTIIGSITLIPGFVAFPTAAILLENGAGIMQIAAFISSLMMVGIVTYSIEKRFFGKKITIIRNIFAFIFSLIVALLIGLVL